MASLTFTTNIEATLDSSEVLIELYKEVLIDGLSGYIIARNIQPIDLDGLSARIILVPPSFNYYRIAATAYNIEPPEEPS